MIKQCMNLDKNAIDEILLSIAEEEKGLSKLYQAEAEKIKVANELWKNGSLTAKEILDIQSSVEKILKIILKSQMLLQFKVDSIIDKKKDVICLPPTVITKYKKCCCCDSSCLPYSPCYINNCCCKKMCCNNTQINCLSLRRSKWECL